VDGAHRAYEPDLVPARAGGERLAPSVPFLRPDGTLDARPALLVRARLVAR
jgi:hypothetical protein